MVLQQRQAWFHLVVSGTSLILFLGLLPLVGMAGAQAAFAVLAVTWVAPFLFRKRGAAEDERDRMIHLKSMQFTFGVLWLLMIGGVWGLYYTYEAAGAVPTAYLPVIGWMMWIVFLLCQSGAQLVLYRKY